MKERTNYTEAFRKQALEKVYTRGRRTVIRRHLILVPNSCMK